MGQPASGAVRSVRESDPALAGDEVLGVVAETSGVPMPFLRAALAYWGDYPEEVDAFLDRGIDCRAVVADALLHALSDLEIFQTALLEGRVIVTNNVPDFESLRRGPRRRRGSDPRAYLHIRLHISPHQGVRLSAGDGARGCRRRRETVRHRGVVWLHPPG